ncbi:MAG: inositol monophosphatase family protein [Planctomycetota bacterium]|jgi:myo-inositol-1(or 4)-monophosphatase
MSIPHTELSQLLETAVVAARLAGQRAMEELKYARKSVKNGNELVTQADPICQKIIMDRIRETYPEHGFIAEEGDSGSLLSIPPRMGPAIWWVIDPIDGTNNFANGMLNFCVSIAAMLDGEPVVGVIFEPSTDSMFTAAVDMDAQLNGSKITVNEDEISKFASFGVDSHAHPETDAGVQKMMSLTRFRCLGTTAMHLAYVGRGSLIGMVTASAKLWDIAAGVIIIQQAGGIVTDVKGNKLFPVALESYQGEPFQVLSSNKVNHQRIMEIFLKSVIKASCIGKSNYF